MKEITYIQALSEALSEEMERDETVFLIGEDIGAFGGVFGITKGFVEKFGERRVRQTPVSESAIIGTAVGAAICTWISSLQRWIRWSIRRRNCGICRVAR
jgi:pyruvate dehydrogenase E1 component beta subunit